MNKKGLQKLLMVFFLLSSGIYGFEVNGIEYSVTYGDETKNTVSVVSGKNSTVRVVIPETVVNREDTTLTVYHVTSVQSYAFENHTGLTSVVFLRGLLQSVQMPFLIVPI